MNHAPDTDNITSRARKLYRELGPRVDTVTAARLRAARRNVMERAASRPRRPLHWIVPAGAFAMTALAVIISWQPLHRLDTPPAQNAASEQILPPDADQTDPALYQNMDFYAWLADQPAVARQSSHR